MAQPRMADEITSITLDKSLARAGPAAASHSRLWEALWQQGQLPDGLLEFCRLAFARLHRDKHELAATNPDAAGRGAQENLRRLVVEDRVQDSHEFSAGEKAALLFAEYYWLDTQSIPAEVGEAVKRSYGEAGLVLLIEGLGLIDGRIRTARCLRDMEGIRPTREELVHVN